jgi:hypothetical protein
MVKKFRASLLHRHLDLKKKVLPGTRKMSCLIFLAERDLADIAAVRDWSGIHDVVLKKKLG